uniref:PSII M-protein n=2 Tax=Cistanche TaxID=87753 RepID=M4I7I9_CISDE|nr:PSII M-protein [Cistanche deserticola]AFZ99591.1 PSII M-protein [Cistanche deserticola]QIQ22777.1 photosystem II protein M [Cistanche deserticola]QIQ22813.1 photosystem II protein M [Cistanche salsa]
MEVNILAFIDTALFILVPTAFLLICKNSQSK